MTELGIPKGLPTCSHDRLQFGCPGCIERDTQESGRTESNKRKRPFCNACKNPMIYTGARRSRSGLVLEFECRWCPTRKENEDADEEFRAELHLSGETERLEYF